MKLIMNRLLFLTLTIGVIGCTKEDFEGPSINNLYGELSIIDSLVITNKNPDFFNNDEVGFYCKFSKSVAWKLKF